MPNPRDIEISVAIEAARLLSESNQTRLEQTENDITYIKNKFYGLISTSKILEATDSDEYMALDANKKAWYNLFISAGMLDMSDGTKAWDLFLSWIFPPGKITHDALLIALGQ